MDKPKKGHTITIKLNGEHKSYKEELQKQDLEPTLDPIPKVKTNEPILVESEVIQEAAATQESGDESFDWILPESSENNSKEFHTIPPKSPKTNYGKIITTFSVKNRKKTNRPIGQIVTTAVFAVLIGTTIGVFMLKLFITDASENPPDVPTAVGEEAGGEQAQPGSVATTSMPELSTYMIQGGIFSSKEGAQETLSGVKSTGIPAVIIEMDGKHYIYFGVANSLETAKALGTQYKSAGVDDAFAKPLVINEKTMSKLNKNEQSFLEAVPTIYETLTAATSEAIAFKSVSEGTTKALVGLAGQLEATGIKNTTVKDLQAELTSASEQVKAYQKSKNTKDLSEAQQHLLNFLSIYYSL